MFCFLFEKWNFFKKSEPRAGETQISVEMKKEKKQPNFEVYWESLSSFHNSGQMKTAKLKSFWDDHLQNLKRILTSGSKLELRK